VFRDPRPQSGWVVASAGTVEFYPAGSRIGWVAEPSAWFAIDSDRAVERLVIEMICEEEAEADLLAQLRRRRRPRRTNAVSRH
jgi:hypothetical protein